MIKRFWILSWILPACLLGQVSQNSVTVTASRNTNLQPDQVVFNVMVTSGLDATRDTVVAALQGAGITLANFSSVTTIQQYSPAKGAALVALGWSFTLPVALSNMKSTVGLLSAVQASIAKANQGLSMSFTVQGTQVSPQLQQSQTCLASDLIADARAQATKIAAAAGMSVGSVLAASGVTATTDSGSTNPFSSAYTYNPGCSLTVKFALGGF